MKIIGYPDKFAIEWCLDSCGNHESPYGNQYIWIGGCRLGLVEKDYLSDLATTHTLIQEKNGILEELHKQIKHSITLQKSIWDLDSLFRIANATTTFDNVSITLSKCKNDYFIYWEGEAYVDNEYIEKQSLEVFRISREDLLYVFQLYELAIMTL